MSTSYDARIETLFPNLPPQLGDYDRYDRLDMMSEDFLPESWEELRLAFPIWLRARTAQETAATHLDRVYEHQASEAVQTDRPDRAVVVLTQQMVAYAKQARRDLSVLRRLRQDFIEFPAADDSAETLADRLKGSPAHYGPGQLVRFIDVQRITERHGVLGLDFDPMGGQIKKGISGSRGVVDSYTVQQPHRMVQTHIEEALSGYLASDALEIIDPAMNNEFGRLGFWNRNLLTAASNPHARQIARPALVSFGFYSEYRQLPVDELLNP